MRDLETRLHSERVRALSETLGARVGLSSPERGILAIAATFHDIGKIGIPDQVLLKRGRLDEAERHVIEKHAALGAGILLATDLEGAREAARAVRHHHEQFDGGGYPDGLSATEIPICSRIIGVADSYDAMSHTRFYHPAKRHGEIMEILRAEAGRKHDPEISRVFGEVIETSAYRSPDR
jgi:HD-GYP domain-containing protein (c-di-GMP phosphodiesterase class II)